MTEPILTTTQIAERADYTREQIWAKARKGEIPAIRANPGGKHYRYYDSPELRAWCEERAGRRARSLAQQHVDANRTFTLTTGKVLTKPWSWTKAHERLLNRKNVGGDPFAKKQPLLDAVAQDMWRKLAKKHRLSANELLESIRAGDVVRIELHLGEGFKRGGFVSWEGFAGWYRFLRRRIGEEWREWTPQEREQFQELMLPVVE